MGHGRRRVFVTVNSVRARRPPPRTEEPVTFAQLAQVLALLALTLMWMDRHLGFGLRSAGPFAGLFLAAGMVWRWVHGFAQDAAKKAEGRLAGLTRVLFSTPFRSSWAVLLLFCALVFSSVTLVSSSSTPLEATLVPVGRRSLAVWGPVQDGEASRWVVRSSPFGTLFNLSAKGHVRETVEVFPLAGKQIRQRDLRQPSTVLLRPGVEGLKALVHGRLDVWQGKPDGLPIAQMVASRSAALIGMRQALPSAWVEDWKQELQTLAPDPPVAAQILIAWKKPKLLAAQMDLAPGMVIVARVSNQMGHVIAEETVTVGEAPVTDVFLADIDPEE
jgi:hypothetical protein